MPDMAHDAHHLYRLRAHGWNPEALPHRLTSAEGVLRQIVVNHYDQVVPDAILFIKESSFA
jgi:hypothetical protein